MADPEIHLLPDDIRFENRNGCYVLVDPASDGIHDIGSMWSHDEDRFMVRFNLMRPTGEPLPVLPLEAGMQLLLNIYQIHDPLVSVRLEEQSARFVDGFPHVVTA